MADAKSPYELLDYLMQEGYEKYGERFEILLAKFLTDDEFIFLEASSRLERVSGAAEEMGLNRAEASQTYASLISKLKNPEGRGKLEEQVDATITHYVPPLDHVEEKKAKDDGRDDSEKEKERNGEKKGRCNYRVSPRLAPKIDGKFAEYLNFEMGKRNIGRQEFAKLVGLSPALTGFYMAGLGIPTWQEEVRIRGTLNSNGRH